MKEALEGRKVGILVADGSDGETLESVVAAVTGAGGTQPPAGIPSNTC